MFVNSEMIMSSGCCFSETSSASPAGGHEVLPCRGWPIRTAPTSSIANGENSAGGFGLTVDTAREMFDGGVDVITTGNHVWDKRWTILGPNAFSPPP